MKVRCSSEIINLAHLSGLTRKLLRQTSCTKSNRGSAFALALGSFIMSIISDALLLAIGWWVTFRLKQSRFGRDFYGSYLVKF